MIGIGLGRQTRNRVLMACAFNAILLSLPIAASADEVALRKIVASGALGQSPNSVVLEFLLNEGNGILPADLHDEAVEQLVSVMPTMAFITPVRCSGVRVPVPTSLPRPLAATA